MLRSLYTNMCALSTHLGPCRQRLMGARHLDLIDESFSSVRRRSQDSTLLVTTIKYEC